MLDVPALLTPQNPLQAGHGCRTEPIGLIVDASLHESICTFQHLHKKLIFTLLLGERIHRLQYILLKDCDRATFALQTNLVLLASRGGPLY